MYEGKGSLGFDAVICTKGEFLWVPDVDPSPNVLLKMTYVNKKTGETFGVCPVGAALFRQETIEALRKFIQLAEEDFGHRVFEDGSWGSGAETGEGLKPLGG